MSKGIKSDWASMFKKYRRTAGLFVVALAGCSSDASPATTSASSTSVAASVSAAEVAPPTAAPNTVASALPDTTPPAPTTTTVDDQLLEALDRAETAMRNCYNAAPGCDQAELENGLVGLHLQSFVERSESGTTFDNVDALMWTLIDGPTLKGDDLAVFVVCRTDSMVVTYPDGEVSDDIGYALQDWYFLLVGNTWKLSEVINQNDSPLERPCDA